ncbi:MAG: hypothetical protein H6743_03965 [Rickettsiaceae bacterium]|nr:hypothetical protein [Rickettsiaceae bacterium]
MEITRITSEQQKSLLHRHLKERADTQLLVHKDNPKAEINRAVVLKLCENDFTYFANNFVWIQNPRSEEARNKDIPFLLWDYQEQSAKEIIKAIIEGYDLPIEKSRDMGLSWLLVTILVWGWHFHQWESLVGSQKAENVDTRGNIKSLLEKARFISEKLPDWMLPPLIRGVHDKSMILIHPTHHASITGESNNPNFARSDRRKVILFDEFSSWQLTDRQAWTSASSTSRCRIPLSTPNSRGTNCYFYQIVNSAYKKELPVLRLHWTLHPDYSEGLYYNELGEPRSPWYDNECKRATTPEEVSQELDINYEAAMTGKVFPNFSYDVNVDEEVAYNPNLPLYVAWDFGLDGTALIWVQPDRINNKYYVIDEYTNDGTTKEGADIQHYIEVVQSKPYKTALHFGDPHSGENRALSSRGLSNGSILRKNGIKFKSKRTPRLNRILAGRNILKNLRINPNCVMTIEMFSSWQMVRPKSGNKSSETPAHDDTHIGDSYTYFAYNYQEYVNKTSNFERKNYKRV